MIPKLIRHKVIGEAALYTSQRTSFLFLEIMANGVYTCDAQICINTGQQRLYLTRTNMWKYRPKASLPVAHKYVEIPANGVKRQKQIMSPTRFL